MQTTLKIRVIPNAKSNAIDSYLGEFLKIRIKAPALDGKANKELTIFLSKLIGCKKAEIEISHGHTEQNKTLVFHNISTENLNKIIEENIKQKPLL